MKDVAYKVRDLDRAILRVVFRFKLTPLTPVMNAFTIAGKAGALWGVMAFFAFLANGLHLHDLLVPWAAVAVSWTVSEGAKSLFDRARPFVSDTGIAPLTKMPSSSSFPSGHSATAAAGAITLSAVYPAFTPAFILAGVLVALSRIYLGVHYPIDVLAGLLIGATTAFTILALA